MRHVLGNVPETDVTPGEKACRAWLEKSPGPFMEAFDKLEAAGRAIPVERPGEEPLDESETDEEMKAAIRALIQKHAGGK